jgi:hypothetical protein
MFFSKKNTPFQKWYVVLCLENWTLVALQCPARQRWVTDELIRALANSSSGNNPALNLLDYLMQRLSNFRTPIR